MGELFCDEVEVVEPQLTHRDAGRINDNLQDYEYGILFCGHTHCGQFCLRFLGTPFVPARDNRFI